MFVLLDGNCTRSVRIYQLYREQANNLPRLPGPALQRGCHTSPLHGKLSTTWRELQQYFIYLTCYRHLCRYFQTFLNTECFIYWWASLHLFDFLRHLLKGYYLHLSPGSGKNICLRFIKDFPFCTINRIPSHLLCNINHGTFKDFAWREAFNDSACALKQLHHPSTSSKTANQRKGTCN